MVTEIVHLAIVIHVIANNPLHLLATHAIPLLQFVEQIVAFPSVQSQQQ